MEEEKLQQEEENKRRSAINKKIAKICMLSHFLIPVLFFIIHELLRTHIYHGSQSEQWGAFEVVLKFIFWLGIFAAYLFAQALASSKKSKLYLAGEVKKAKRVLPINFGLILGFISYVITFGVIWSLIIWFLENVFSRFH